MIFSMHRVESKSNKIAPLLIFFFFLLEQDFWYKSLAIKKTQILVKLIRWQNTLLTDITSYCIIFSQTIFSVHIMKIIVLYVRNSRVRDVWCDGIWDGSRQTRWLGGRPLPLSSVRLERPQISRKST